MSNLFAGVPSSPPDEHLDVILETPAFRLERIVSRGHASPPGFWYDQDGDEWVVLVSGRATLRFEDEPKPRTLVPGDHLLIAAHRRHRVDWAAANEPTIWLALHVKAPPGGRPAAP
ncbi:MAG: cupin domain-containing protein [Candidatus Rokubacteria bacterium]|nr:cupin domain-containing protein [Candidatus Rokubacteria bacterium]MBI3827820.1 cupin domain-containing protein [Candidatus Rokubacteria bacterium]